MIPFASQRASGQDLATHLMNNHDNEHMEVASLRGAVAQDLHGAFAEWEAHAHALTQCQKYLYSLSINPDPSQGPLTRAQYDDYIDRVEDCLGLAGQPRAIVYHIKPDKDGSGREHCHVVWSRIDVENAKAVQLAFDHQKLMTVTRDFARDHGLKLPAGYDRADEEHNNSDQLSLYEKAQQERTSLTKQQRMTEVTGAWSQSDSAKAFVSALEELGYVLAKGRRPYVLVDRYGEMNALPKLIDDKQVRSKDVRAFLEKDFPTDSLPSVDEARKAAAQRRKAREAFDGAQQRGQVDELRAKHAKRRQELERHSAKLSARHAAQSLKLSARQQNERQSIEAAYRRKVEGIKRERLASRPTGLAAFLGRITGMDFLTRAVRVQMDAYRRRAHQEELAGLDEYQRGEHLALKARHKLQRSELKRRLRVLGQIERRELGSLATQLLCEDRARARDERTKEGENRMNQSESDSYIDLQEVFTRAAAHDQGDEEEDAGGADGGELVPKNTFGDYGHKRPRKDRNKDSDTDF